MSGAAPAASNEVFEQIDLADSLVPGNNLQSKIRRHEATTNTEEVQRAWRRELDNTGHCAIRVKTFFCRLRDEAMATIDEEINAFFDQHPEAEIKKVTTTVGEMVNYKTIEPCLIVNVWM